MSSIEETELAGIGRRFVVMTNSGSRIIIVVHDSGMAELYQTTPDDPERTIPVATFTDDEARLVAAIIGRTIYRPEEIERLNKYGVAITWHPLKGNSYAIRKTVGDLFQNAGVAVLVVVEKDGKRQTSPSRDYVLQEGSHIALAGSRKDLQRVGELLEKGR